MRHHPLGHTAWLYFGLMFILFIPSTMLAQGSPQPAENQQAPEFQFVAGSKLVYRVEQETTIVETTREGLVPTTAMTATKLNLKKVWEVKAVSPEQIANLELRITEFKQTINRPGPKDKDGKPTIDRLVIDSSTAEGQAELAAFLNKPIMTISIDQLGRITQVSGATDSARERLEQEPPFRVVWPRVPAERLEPWERTFTIKSPLGTGEQYKITQQFTPQPAREGFGVLQLKTSLPESTEPAELPPLVPILWQGEVYWDLASQSYAGARLEVNKEVTNHQGEGSLFRYEGKYLEAREK